MEKDKKSSALMVFENWETFLSKYSSLSVVTAYLFIKTFGLSMTAIILHKMKMVKRQKNDFFKVRVKNERNFSLY